MRAHTRLAVYVMVFALLAATPTFTELLGKPFYLDLASRLVILALAAVGLNLVLGFGGMISFGHAAYIGIGAYCVGIPAYYGYYNGFLHIGLAILVCGLFAAVTGAISLRTKGVHFIMITMAFAQMVFFAFVSIEEYGGDDGLVIELRSKFTPFFNLENNVTLYYTALALLAVTLFLVYRLVHARFGIVLQGIKGNEHRMQALGYNTYQFQLTAYILSGMICGLAGVLLGNFTSFISPEMMDWTRSGELIFMVVLGGAGTILGPILGSAAFILLEEWLSGLTLYWQFFFGIFLILVVLFGRGGLAGLFARGQRQAP